MRCFLSIVASILLGFVLMIPLAMLFDAMKWPLFHSWGLAHGSYLFAWPLLTVIAYGLLAVFVHAVQWYKHKKSSRPESKRR